MGWLITLGILVLLAVLPLGIHIRYDEDGVLGKLIAGPIRILLFRDRKRKRRKSLKRNQSPRKRKNLLPLPQNPRRRKRAARLQISCPL